MSLSATRLKPAILKTHFFILENKKTDGLETSKYPTETLFEMFMS